MASDSVSPLLLLAHLPASLPLEGALRLELQDGAPVLHASTAVQQRIATLLAKLQQGNLSPEETAEFGQYEDLDEYLSFLNRVVCHLRTPVQG